jgi:hypothetical protein
VAPETTVAAPSDQVTLSGARPASATQVFPDSTGKITHLALQLDSSAPRNIKNEVFNAWTQVFKAMDPDVRFTLVLESARDRERLADVLKENKIENPERFNVLDVNDLNITLWSRDQMVGLQGPGHTTLLGQTTMRPHGDDELLPPRIADSADGVTLDGDKRLVTDGGDGVSNTKETFLGYASLYLTAEKLFEDSGGGPSPFSQSLSLTLPQGGEGWNMPDFSFSPNPLKSEVKGLPNETEWLNRAKDLFEEKYGQPITVVGQDDPNTPEFEEPATFHIDMGLTPVGNDLTLVGDPRAAVEILNGLSPEEYAEHNRLLNSSLGTRGRDHLESLIQENTERHPNLQHQFDYNAEHMGRKGYQVERLPYLQGPDNVSWVTYNNCLLEDYKREDGSVVKRVFLPTYGLPALDKAAVDVYESLGFEVVPLQLPALTSWRGAIRCISNILGRAQRGT